MILVDTSVWIELLSPRKGLDASEDDLFRFATAGPIVQEVQQGLRPVFKATHSARHFS